MRKVTCLLAMLMAVLGSLAQGRPFVRYDCLGGTATAEAATGKPAAVPQRRLPSPKTQWDSTRTYPVAVVLVQFTDRAFSSEDPLVRYDSIFNHQGYNEGKGPGSVADYFRTQSGGLFHPRFDIYGPVNAGTSITANGTYGGTAFRTATQKLADSLKVNFAPYDWDGNGTAEGLIFIYAGYSGNESAQQGKGYIWPNTSSFSTVTAADGVKASVYSASAELWSNDKLCGIGTVCHEYTHALGLPDIYPTTGNEYSVADEWDLMDGGNFTNNGWCPPNFSAHEKMLLGWLAPIELTEETTVADMKAVSEGGNVYIIRTADNPDEFYLLENRQWTGWDQCAPGRGLLISHVDYLSSAWTGNSVNNTPSHHRYDLVHADGRDYDAWDQIVGKGKSPYVNSHSRILSGTPYPYVTDDQSNNQLTDTSTPAATIFSGTKLMSKPITNIQMTDDGVVSFSFMGIVSAIAGVQRPTQAAGGWLDLQGRRVARPVKGIYIRNGKKFIF